MLRADADLQDVLVLNLSRAVQVCVGFRNIAVHNCEAIDCDIVFALTGSPLSDFDQFALHIAARLH